MLDLVLSELPTLRAAAESLMTDTCAITKPPTRGPINNATGKYPVVPGASVYSGKCRLQTGNPGAVTSGTGDVAERQFSYTESVLQLPVDGTDDVGVDDVVTIQTSTHNAGLVDRRFTIVALQHKSQPVMRRFLVREVAA